MPATTNRTVGNMPRVSPVAVSLVQIGGPQPPISKMLSFEVDLI
jgi:hypothetical protein